MPKKKKVKSLFKVDKSWKKHWQDMPEFKQKNLTSFQHILVHFETKEDREEFSKLIDQKLTDKTRSIWFPEAEIGRTANKRYIDKRSKRTR